MLRSIRFAASSCMIMAFLSAVPANADVTDKQPDAASASATSTVLHEGAYDPGNVFARIIRGEIPCWKVYEDDHVLAFLDIHPIERGHVLVISKTSQARTLFEMDPDDVDRLMAVVRKVGAGQVAALGVGGVTVIENNGLGQSIPHVHFHVIPRRSGGELKMPTGAPPEPQEQEEIAAKLRAAIG